jgi:SAM-dependent methyltransferase
MIATPSSPWEAAVPLVYSAAIFASALLLFLVQPMAGKLLLPLVGGTPAAWNTCMLFFQALLLAGYAYAHWSTARFGPRRQAALHLGLVGVTLAVLYAGPAVRGNGSGPLDLPYSAPAWFAGTENPVPALLAVLALTVGLPFFVLSATAPLLQRWFADTGHPSGRDPYFLYAASNLGSLAGLVAYPFVLEPALALRDQGKLWAAGFVVFGVLGVLAALLLWRSAPAAPAVAADDAPAADDPPPTPERRAWWVLMAAGPSSLMLGCTTFLTTDIAPVPLLWVVPLGLYLATFILVFARRKVVPDVLPRMLAPILIVALLVTLLMGVTQPIWLLVPLHLTTFFVVALALHGALAADRPGTSRLTEFYLWMSLGGVLGGLVNALIAPVLIRHAGLIEYPLALTLAAALVPAEKPSPRHWTDVVLPMLVGGITLCVILIVDSRLKLQGSLRNAVAYGVPAVLAFTLVGRPLRYGLGLLALWLAASYTPGQSAPLVLERNFFGVLKVAEWKEEGETAVATAEGLRQNKREYVVRRLVHGSTTHGLQSDKFVDADGRHLPLSYYHTTGPIGQVFRQVIEPGPAGQRVAAVGLGTGSLAYYARPDQDWVFFEIDPAVKRISTEENYFAYWGECRAASKRLELGDARLRLALEPDASFDLIVLDAFSSDAIPIHLITREALELYLRKLKPTGRVALHVSNRYLELVPVLAKLGASFDPPLLGINWHDDGNEDIGKYGSEWVLMAPTAEGLGRLGRKPSMWDPLTAKPETPLWTDDFSNVWSVFQWGLPSAKEVWRMLTFAKGD